MADTFPRTDEWVTRTPDMDAVVDSASTGWWYPVAVLLILTVSMLIVRDSRTGWSGPRAWLVPAAAGPVMLLVPLAGRLLLGGPLVVSLWWQCAVSACVVGGLVAAVLTVWGLRRSREPVSFR
ncbi:hypothetical protein [Kitasatospora sp. NPDC001527]|uniref:hypothetical protein n=1 Tax=Kitasatospora sp. NPDC001527 TaxID=3154519 RepID=UPI0033235501